MPGFYDFDNSLQTIIQWILLLIALLLSVLHVAGVIGPNYVTEESLAKHSTDEGAGEAETAGLS